MLVDKIVPVRDIDFFCRRMQSVKESVPIFRDILPEHQLPFRKGLLVCLFGFGLDLIQNPLGVMAVIPLVFLL